MMPPATHEQQQQQLLLQQQQQQPYTPSHQLRHFNSNSANMQPTPNTGTPNYQQFQHHLSQQQQLLPLDSMVDANDGLDTWLTNGQGQPNSSAYLPDFDVPFTPSGYLDLGVNTVGPIKNDISFMSTHGSLDAIPHQAGSTNGTVNLHLNQSATAQYSMNGHHHQNGNGNIMNGQQMTDDQQFHGLPSPPANGGPCFQEVNHSIIDSSSSAALSSSMSQQQYIDATFSKSIGMNQPIGKIGHLGTMGSPHMMSPETMYNQSYQMQPQAKQEPQQNGSAHQPTYRNAHHQQSQSHSTSRMNCHNHHRQQSSSGGMEVNEYIPTDGVYFNDQHSIDSHDADSSAVSSPDVHLQGLSSSGHSSDRSSNQTSPLVSTPEDQPATPTPLQHQLQQQPSSTTSNSRSLLSLPSTTPQLQTRTSTTTSTNSQNGNHTPTQETKGAGSSRTSRASENISNSCLVTTLQSATDTFLNVSLSAGSGKKKTWPTRLVSLQSLHNPTLTYAQLLFHVANISTFLTVSVEGKEVHNAQSTGLPSPTNAAEVIQQRTQAPVVVSLQDHPILKSRLDQLRSYARQHGLANGSRENSGSSTDRSTQRSSRSSPMVEPPANNGRVSGLEFPPLEITFHLADNVKSCTRLGCLNLLVNKANRRACNICQSYGAEINPSLLRRLVINPHHSSTQYAYLEQLLEDYEYWKFDSVDDHPNAASSSNQNFPFVNQIGFYIAFVDSTTAAHVEKDFNHKIGFVNNPNSLNQGGEMVVHQPNQQNEFVTLNGPNAPINPLMTSICEVDLNFTYAIKMKSHFWMLEVKPKSSPNSASTRLKSKFYKKVGRPTHNRTAAALSAAAAAANFGVKSEEFGGDALMPYNPRNTALGQKRRFDDTEGPVANVLAVNHINHINITMPNNMNNMMNMNNLLTSGNGNNSSSHSGGATIEVIEEDESGPTNTVHVSDNAFRLMKNQPVSAMMNIHDTSATMTDTKSADGSDGSSTTSNNNEAKETVDSKPLVGQPTPVVLVYRDVDAYQRDALFGPNASNGNNSNGNNNNGNNNGGNGFNNNGGNGFDNNDNNNGGNGNNHGNSGSNKRTRFDPSFNGGNGNNGNTTFSMATVATPVLGVMPGVPLGGVGLNAASMAGVAAAMNQFQLAQVAQAAQAQGMMQQQFMMQQAMNMNDFGRFPAPWMFQDRAAASEKGVQPENDVPHGPMSTDGTVDPTSDGGLSGADRTKATTRQKRAASHSNGDLSETFDDPDDDETKEDGRESRDGSTLESRLSVVDDEEDEDGDDGENGHDKALGGDIRVRIPNAGDDDDDDINVFPFDPSAQEGRIKTPHKPGPSVGLGGGLLKKNRLGAGGLNSPLDVDQLLLIEDDSGGVMKGLKPTAQTSTGPNDNYIAYRAFAGLGPASDFFRSFHFFQQSFWGMLSALLFGLVALIILVYNVRQPDSGDMTATKMQLLRWDDIYVDSASPAPTTPGKTSSPSPHGRAPFEPVPHEFTLHEELLNTALATVTTVSKVDTPTNSTDDPTVLSRKLLASIQLFAAMRDSSSILNIWAATSPTVVLNMLNPPPGSPAVVNVDVITSNSNSAVRIGRAIGDYLLVQNGLLAAYGFMAAPPSLPFTLNAPALCGQLINGIGPIYMYVLTCQQWIVANSLNIVLPSTLSCKSAQQFDDTFTQPVCESLLSTVKTMNMTNVFFSPYNTSSSVGSSPTVLFPDTPTRNVPATIDNTPSHNTTEPPLGADAALTLKQLPHLAAMNFYGQASDLRALAINFGIINTIISTTGPAASGSATTPTSTSSSTTSGRDYRANGVLFAVVALGSLGMFYLVQMLLFVVIVGGKGIVKRLHLAAFGVTTNNNANRPTNSIPMVPLPNKQPQPLLGQKPANKV